ncbi:MAG TPA: arylsulfotransferase family protein [Solirubrobacteraceae bacterium]|nr:arylsulfotransferase family protein [Solirubrobacteraceae bacterium]
MARAAHTITRRQLLRSAGAGAAGLALSGTLAELLIGGGGPVPAVESAGAAVPPQPPRFRTRPDLRIPTLAVTRNEPGASTDPIFIAPYNSPTGQAGAVITDAGGEPLWENPLANKVTTNFRVQSYRGSPVLTWWEGDIELGHGVGEYVIADASYRTIRRVQAAGHMRGDLHEFVITPRDTALLTSYVVRDWDLMSVGGPAKGTIQDARFQEIDLASGRLLLEWRSVDHVSLEESYSPVEANWDFFHINSVDLDTDGNLLVSARSTHTVYKIARDGQIMWRLGGKYGDFEMGPDTGFAWQHHARRQADGTLTLFDNGATPAVERRSRGLILDVDEAAMTATLVREYSHAGVLSGSQGSVQLLANGNVFICWGETPRVSEFDRSGNLLFDAVLGEKYECYRAFRLPWSGRPAAAPAIALDGSGRSRTVYASWNGATEVHTWRLLAGARRDDLRAVASTPRQGFESVLALPPRHGGHVAVEALDAHGRPLGRSPTVKL